MAGSYKLLLTLLLAFQSMLLYGQAMNNDSIVQRDLGFINYLIGKTQYDDAIYVLGKHLIRPGMSIRSQDTLNSLLGWSYYSIKKLENSSEAFKKVSRSSPSYLKARFFYSYNQLYLGNYQFSEMLLDSLELYEPWLLELRAFEKAGISLLKRDTSAFNKLSKQFTSEFYPLATEELNMKNYAEKIRNFKKKSTWKAVTLSALVPGLGKIYAGKLGEGISSFFIVTALGAVTYENIHKDGLLDVKSLFFGSLFAIYYGGNIAGTAAAVKRHNNQFNHEIDQNILLDLHIPLRTVFN
jgi:hypothetical protein